MTTWAFTDFAIHCYLAWARLVDELLQWPEELCGINTTGRARM